MKAGSTTSESCVQFLPRGPNQRPALAQIASVASALPKPTLDTDATIRLISPVVSAGCLRVAVCLVVCLVLGCHLTGKSFAIDGEIISASPGDSKLELTTLSPGLSSMPIRDPGGPDDEDLMEPERPLNPPDDPCLSPLYRDWREFSLYMRESGPDNSCAAVRIVVDRSTFTIRIECQRRDGSVDADYTSEVGIGDVSSPTPEGSYIVNHIYCYPDVVFFSQKSERIPALYNGFFAPLLSCDESGRCHRHQDLGIHGFQASAHPNPRNVRPETAGAVSAGCIRVPDPCRMKRELIRLVGVGPLRRNDRGFYHWLNRPVELVVEGAYPGDGDRASIAGIVEQGVSELQRGLRSLWDIFSEGDGAR